MARSSKQAYYLLDISAFAPDVRQELMEDALMGAAQYGVRIVEHVHNGPATTDIYGVYFGVDDEKWQEAKKEFGIEDDEADEDGIRDAATAVADEQAAAVAEKEEAEVTAVVGDGTVVNKARR